MKLWIAGLIIAVSTTTQAAIKTEAVSYKEGKTELEGYLVYDDSIKTPRPGIIIVHQWMGLSNYEKGRAEQLAKAGYVAFAADIYGKSIRPHSPQEAGKVSGPYKENRNLYRSRVKAAFDFVKNNKHVDSKKIVVMGYCFGGMGALELARSGAPVSGVVSFHGALSNPNPKDASNIKGKTLVLHGAIDPYVPMNEVEAFMSEMNQAGADYQFIAYSGAVHAFTDKGAGTDIKAGAAYNEVADRRSWQAFMDFLHEVVPVKP
ncbi:Carboxymethylenebutenolidase [compost metagenome]